MRGDIDGDGKITENDRNRINEHLGGTITLTGADSWCAKVTGNNEISASDLVQLMRYLEGKTNNLTGIPTFADYYNNWTYHKVDDLTGYWTAEIAINGLKTTSDAIVNISNDEGIFYKSELSDGAIRFYATRPPIAEVFATITFKSGTGVITTSYECAKFHASTHSKNGADPIAPTAIGAVGYDAAQSLTDAQKTKARGNIDAAPDGFGLGGVLADAPENSEGFADANLITATGFYRAVRNVLYGGWHYIIHLNYDSATALQLAAYVSGEVYGVREKRLNVWGDWEHTNPPMELGVEYRTTERYLGKPVYYKIVDCGQIADNKQVEHGIVNMRDCISFQGLRGSMPMPSISNNNLSDPWSYYVADVDRTKITLACGTSAAGDTCHVMLKYTKTTD